MDMETQGKRILIVEDEKMTREALKKKLENEGFSIQLAGDGAEGLRIALDDHPDLILLDIVLPVMDGVTFLEELRKDTWGKTALVIVLSNLNKASALDDSEEMGVRQYLIKTEWKLADVVDKVKSALGI